MIGTIFIENVEEGFPNRILFG
jgi:hypothetical protein